MKSQQQNAILRMKRSSKHIPIEEFIYSPYIIKVEGIAKLLCPEKSMILRPVASGSIAATVHLTRPTPCGLDEKNGRNWPQKGEFNGQMNFAIPSVDRLIPKQLEKLFGYTLP
ncbi:MAG: hypothetical protein HYZ48_01660 [Chlamydiales bacterium]|nr:hypothetical protein [Chlamydiales bacterium]